MSLPLTQRPPTAPMVAPFAATYPPTQIPLKDCENNHIFSKNIILFVDFEIVLTETKKRNSVDPGHLAAEVQVRGDLQINKIGKNQFLAKLLTFPKRFN